MSRWIILGALVLVAILIFTGSDIGGLILILVAICVYFIPSIVAFNRKKTNAGAILALNIFLGWTLLGWVVALVWALTHDAPRLDSSDEN